MTLAEKAVLLRRRKGLNQSEMAEEWGVTRSVLSAVERGDCKINKLPNIRVPILKKHEACFIARRRAWVYQKHVAEALGVSRLWVNKMEKGLVNCERLCEYWGIKE